MAGYIRQDTTNNIANGNIINANDLDNEYDAIAAAFGAITGHKHDGTDAEGAPITKVGPVQDVVVSSTAVTPKTDNTVDLGSSSNEFKDLYIDGVANIDSLVADTADINGGTVDNASVGATTPSTGAFTTLTSSSTTTLNGTSIPASKTLLVSTDIGVSVQGYDADLAAFALKTAPTGDVVGTSDAQTLTNKTITDGVIDGTTTVQNGTANGVAYLNGSKVLTTGSALTFDGTNLGVGTTTPIAKLAVSDGIVAFETVPDSPNGVVFLQGLNRANQTTPCAFGINVPVGEFSIRTGVSGGLAPERLRLDTNGNLGLGVTPSAWGGGYKGFQITDGFSIRARTGDFAIGNNWYFDGTNFKYLATTNSTLYSSGAGTHSWFTAPSGTAGNPISFTQAMTLSASAELNIDSGTGGGRLTFTPSSANNTISATTTGFGAYNILRYRGTQHQWLDSAGTQAMTLDASGKLSLGATSGLRTVNVRNNSTASTDMTLQSNSFNGSTGYATLYFGNLNNDAKGYVNYETLNSFMSFGTEGTERVRIDSSGNLLVGKTAESESGVGVSITPVGYARFTTAGTSSQTMIQFNNNGGNAVGAIITSGSTTSYNTSSDYRLKHDISPMQDALARVQQLKPVTYKWNADNSDGEGFIAHELAEVCPQAVTGEKDAVDADGKPVYQGIDTSFLVATLTAAIQEQQAIIEQLKARITALEAK